MWIVFVNVQRSAVQVEDSWNRQFTRLDRQIEIMWQCQTHNKCMTTDRCHHKVHFSIFIVPCTVANDILYSHNTPLCMRTVSDTMHVQCTGSRGDDVLYTCGYGGFWVRRSRRSINWVLVVTGVTQNLCNVHTCIHWAPRWLYGCTRTGSIEPALF